MRASLIQIDVSPDEPVNSRRERVASLVREQAAADLVVLPELWPTGAWAYEAFAAEAEPLRGPTYEIMSKAARDAGVWLHAGSFVERDDPEGPGDRDGTREPGGGTLYNTSLVFAPDGELAASYRKIHRFGFDEGEAAMMGAGTAPVTVPLPSTTLGLATTLGPATTLGLATCYDLRFPELFRALVDAGAELLVVPAGWPERRRGHWTLLAQARAVENQAYVLACGTAGTHAGVEQAGHSIVVDPWGEVLAEAGLGEEVLSVEIDPGKVATTRKRFPVLRDRVLGLDPPHH